MSRISVALAEDYDTFDVSNNPEILLMLSQGDDEIDETTSLWLAGQSVTKPKNSDTKEIS